jgi:hypothetical protein
MGCWLGEVRPKKHFAKPKLCAVAFLRWQALFIAFFVRWVDFLFQVKKKVSFP